MGLLADKADTKPDFLIEGFLSSSTTTVTAKPTSGKSRLVAAMVAAVARGDSESCGRSVNGHGPVMVISTDPGEAEKWGRRMREHAGINKDNVLIARFDNRAWPLYEAKAKAIGAKMLVFDNVLGATEGQINDADPGLILRPLTRIAEGEPLSS